ncbi:hypothetical protein [Paraflavitalea speifideaquila]|uniref:hypothetical protein n=1 Tax=Paraflavitalea speifideaquila TaxID=3076558 RepID=UPI0028EAB773|nr:hypothetical protein [Paraflavitalea speifideiaquila]
MLDKNPGLQATALADYYVNIYFTPGSEGSSLQGLNLSTVYVGASNITISRCRITSYLYLGYNYATGQQPAVSNINVFSNFLSGGGFYDYGEVSGLLVSNNIFYSITITLDNSTGLFTNNVVTSSGINLNSFIIRNNIISAQCITSSGSVIQNNLFSISSCANVPAGNNNVFSVNLANVFANWNGGSIAADNQLVLKAGSPAINAGINGNGTPTDAGVFGGDAGFTYRLSGIPAIPAIYQLSAPSQTASNNPYTITVSVRSNN